MSYSEQRAAEADEVGTFLFEHEGVKCAVRRFDKSRFWTGYVQVEPDHPWFDKDCTNYQEMNPQVHGGLTFSGTPEGLEGRWVGFDCGHFGDYTPFAPGMDRLVEPHSLISLSQGSWKNKEYVTRECKGLAEQYKAAVLSPQEQYIRQLGDIFNSSAMPYMQSIRDEIVKAAALVATDAWSKGRREAFAEEGIGCYARHPGEYEHCSLSKEHEGPHKAAGLTWE